MTFSRLILVIVVASLCLTQVTVAQQHTGSLPQEGKPKADASKPPAGGFPFPGFGPPTGFGGPPGFGGKKRELLSEFDLNHDGWLNADERKLARVSDKNKVTLPPFGPSGPGRPGGARGPFGEPAPPPTPGRKMSPKDVVPVKGDDLYDPQSLRTLFLTFENEDWEKELSDFHGSDVDVSANLTVDGKEYRNVGVHFRGLSSYMGVSAGSKRSLNVSLDLVDSKQRLYGQKTLNLLNGHEDDSMMSSALYSQIARQYIPTPKANFVQVVINGENWGVYSNLQQFDKEFLKSNYASSKGTRWKVKGNPGADGGLRYLGDKVDEYKSRYTIKSTDNPQAWQDLIELCRVLNETPVDRLEDAIRPMLDIDNVLKFLALDIALVNNDGYWVRSSDYNIYEDENRVFHLIPHDMNEALHGVRGLGPGGRGPGFGGFGGPGPGSGGGGPGAQRGPGGFGPPGMMGGDVKLDPLVGLDDARKPLRSKLLAVPSLKKKYLQYVRAIADRSMAQDSIGPAIESFRKLIDAEVQLDTKKLATYEAFAMATSSEIANPDMIANEMNLRTFFEQRRTILLNNPEIAKVEAAAVSTNSSIPTVP